MLLSEMARILHSISSCVLPREEAQENCNFFTSVEQH